MSLYRRMVLVVALVMVACVFLLPAAPAEEQDGVRALFINVGKADAALFFLNGQRFLIDTGTKGSFDALERALEIYRVERLDGVLITHTDKDHVGGLKKLLKSGVQVSMLYAGSLHSEPSDEEHPVYEASKKYGVPMTWLEAGERVDLGGGCAFQVLGPLTRDPEKENNNSLVLDLQTPEGNMLLTGDMELQEEGELLERGLIPAAAVLKVPHHGEDDATSKAFVLKVKPQWAVVSTSTAEEPDTPDSKIMSRLWEVQAGVAVTQSAEIGILVTLKSGMASAERIDLK